MRLQGQTYTYYLIKDKNIKSIDNIKKTVGKYFRTDIIDDFYAPCPRYYEYNGRVYAYAPGVGGTFGRINKIRIKFM